MSQVVHKALAKQPWYRFSTSKEFGEALLKACRGEPLEYFDNAKIKPRLERAAASFNSGDYEFASEVLTELEGEGYLDQSITLLRRRVDQASRQRRVKQLLESATRYFEANEYPLALRKIQEGLELDPENTDALSLKSRVERERREKKIDEWITLARQHLQNQAFHPAREALDNVLKIKPNDTAALSLLADVDRNERDFAKTRQKKSALYEAAVQAWERGEVTAALSKLDVLMLVERESPESDNERSNTYQIFYNRVRSEHDDLKNAYEQARRDLSAENFDAALEVCRQSLQKYPNHALFQALNFDVEERRRQKLSSLIAETDRRVDEEPDLDRRFSLLEEAAKAYPDEKHFQSALKLVRDKRDLVNSIINKARYYEERGQFNEALDQWQIIRSIHVAYPGISFEIDRLQNRRNQQAHQTARTRAIEEIERHVDSGSYDRALTALRAAMSEFPGDKELPELEELVLKNKENAAQALALLGKAKELGDAEKQEESLTLLREARQLDPRNSVIRTVLVNSLLSVAAQKKDAKDWEGAEPLIRELLEIQPNHPPAVSLLSQVGDQRQEEFVSWCLAQARRMQRQDDYDGALALVQQGLEADPKEPRLQQLRTTLLQRQAEALHTVSKVPTGSTPAGTPSLTPVALSSSAVAAGGPPAQASGAAQPEQKPVTGPLLADQEDKTSLFAPIGEAKPPGGNGSPPPTQRPPAVSGPQGETQTTVKPEPIRPHDRRSWILAIGGAAAVIALLAISLFIGRPSSTGAKPKVTELTSSSSPTASNVSVHCNQPTAEIYIDQQLCGTGQCQLPLAQGSHQIEARLTGYEGTPATIEIKPGQTVAPLELTLTPQLPTLIVSTNLNQASVQVDSEPPVNVQDGEAQIKDLPAGAHTIHFKGEQYTVNFNMTAAPAKAAEIQPLTRQPIWVSIGSVLGTEAKIFSNMLGAQIAVNGKNSGRLDKPEFDATGLTPGQNEITLTLPTGAVQRLPLISGPLPQVVANLGIDKNGGTLQIDTGEDDAAVYINGKKMARPTARGGHYFATSLPPGAYKVRVEKDGFIPVPETTATVKAGQQANVSLMLMRIPTTGSLMVKSSQAGAEVFLDGRRLGATGADGTLLANDVPPGRHTVIVRKAGFRQAIGDETFTAGSTTTMDASMQSAIGNLKIEVAPAGLAAHLSIRREGDDAAKTISEGTSPMNEGPYTITASAPGYLDVSQPVRVIAGQTTTTAVVLKPVAAKVEKPKGIALGDWEKTGGWEKDGPYLSRKGGGIVFAPSAGEAGHYAFSAKVIKGKRLEWFVNYVDERNNVLFQLDDDHLTATSVVDGSKKTIKVPVRVNKEETVSVVMDIGDSSVSVNVAQQDRKFPASLATGHAAGKFAFRVPGKDEIELNEFHFVPR
jgi:serine/threonine-protein kinase